MRVLIKKWGNSAAVRIPTGILEAARLELNDAVDVREEGGRIFIEPIRRELTLDQLLEGVTPENMHTEVEFGGPVGKESL